MKFATKRRLASIQTVIQSKLQCRTSGVYLWPDSEPKDGLPDAYTITTGTFELEYENGPVVFDPHTGPEVNPGPKYAAV